jgi:hypothetical protein
MSIAENIAKIEERLLKACDRAGRKRDEITLMGVSKFEPQEKIREACLAGIRFFGESRVKEAAEKFETQTASPLSEGKPGFRDEFNGVQVHLIGSLQRNKAKQAMLLFDCIQSVDREELITELVKHSALRDKPINVLLELHTGEETKSGFAGFDALLRAAEMVLTCDKLRLSGLMTMAPYTTDTDLIRSSFRQLVKAKCELEKRFPNGNFQELSMGMSNDFEIAIEEGSTLLRIGSAIFKE